ncbi:branched-chain amino acid transport system II carrier protein [Schaalia sp. ZJ405]|uniref:branched-chain amino acid transport system II carrier protein n=1 Tax=Schaalia sp. ZJ405 TaxID=2709403 RepID=UPI0013EC4381|nr:branched-chain amino acid transport system II carrier protein [Schaalia sp. ZJ405]QPK80493.1 branched-chain amino acid transport system II carrier protein [Schaalia sp. ZJ405]
MLLIATSLMLFSMFFGAGNLIFPPMVGALAGTHFIPAMTGMLVGSVVLPVIAIIAVASSGTDVRDLASRGGRIFGVVFSVLVYLAIGAFYALPRTGAVSFATAIVPVTGWNSPLASAIFNAIFFGVALFLSWNPRQIVTSLGKFLTPALLTLLVVLVTLVLIKLPYSPGAPMGDYISTPLTAGLKTGYMTMDAIAALAFGIIVVTSLNKTGGAIGAKTLHRTALAALISGVLLAIVYVGLGIIGNIMPNASSDPDGAHLLSQAAHMTMGPIGQIVFGLIVLTACLTTAVGLLASTSEFFERLVPRTTYKFWLLLFTAFSFALASAGLDSVLRIAEPIITFLYSIAITIIIVTLVTYPLRLISPLTWTFRLSAWVAAGWSALTTAAALGFGTDIINAAIGWMPGQTQDFGWAIPTGIAFLIGLGADMSLRKR